MRLFCIVFVGFLGVLLAPAIVAQNEDEQVTVPDVVGMPIPQAISTLNEAGFRLGELSSVGWTEDTGLPQNTISVQSLEPGETLAYGTPIDLTVLRSLNAAVLYDDNDLTVINTTSGQNQLAGLTFQAAEGPSFNATRWTNVLRPNQCTQIWSVRRNGPKAIDECETIQNWLTTTDTSAHFWTTTSGVTEFNIVQNGSVRATCPAAPSESQDQPLRCAFYMDGTAAEEVAPFLYMAYTTDGWIVHNNTEERWMSLENVFFSVTENAQGNEFTNAATDNPDRLLSDIQYLAPDQCLFAHAEGFEGEPPEDCTVVAEFTLAPTDAFWLRDLWVTSATDVQQRNCPPATPESLTICILPR